MNEPLHAASSLADDFHPSALADIYQRDVSLAIWRRKLDSNVAAYAASLLGKTPRFQTRFIRAPSTIVEQLDRELPFHKYRHSFMEDVALVVDMFSCLFELDAVGLRMAVLNTAMCPKFHVDRVPCRLICTYAGTGTEWLSHSQVQRFEDRSLIPLPGTEPNLLYAGDVALLKGEAWEGNEGRGLVHRSPSATDKTRRLVLTLDFA